VDQAGRDVEIVWNGRRALAFVPSRLSERTIDIGVATAGACGSASAELTMVLESGSSVGQIGRLLVRAEGVASSFIEGVRAPVLDVALADAGWTASPAAAWIAHNLHTLDVVRGAVPDRLSVAVLCEWHRRIMTGTQLEPEALGVVRTSQGWIGGTSPLDAHLVTPPPGEVPDLLDDLVVYANRLDIDPIVQAAVVHAQFELIHPFADGNGRTGRLLAVWVLLRRLGLHEIPPLSSWIARDVGGYSEGLTLFRFGQDDAWVRWFANITAASARSQRAIALRVTQLLAQWRSDLAQEFRTDATLFRVLDLLPVHVAFTASDVAKCCGVSYRNAVTALSTLREHGVFEEIAARREGQGRGRPSTLFVATPLLDALSEAVRP
jgi:Fic family protein